MSFASTTALPEGRSWLATAILNGYLYAIGGQGQADTAVSSGSGETWTRNGTATFSADANGQYLDRPADIGAYASTPDSPGLGVVGDIDIKAKVAMGDWTPGSNDTVVNRWTGGNSYALGVQTSGKIALWVRLAGGAEFPQSTVAVPFADGAVGWIRAKRVAATGTVTFETSTDYDPVAETGTWTALGVGVASTAGAIVDNNAMLSVGPRLTAFVDFKCYYAEVRDGIDGTIVASFNADDFDAAVDEVYFAAIASDGTVGAWTATQSLPAKRRSHAALAVHRAADGKDYLVVIGGRDASTTDYATVYYTTQTTGGALNAWSTSAASMPAARHAPSVALIGERLYLTGYATTSIYTTTIDHIVAGTAWSTLAGSSVLPAARSNCRLTAHGRVLHLTGGHDGANRQTTVYAGVVTEMAGTPSIAWEATTALTEALDDHQGLVYDRHIYVIGGETDSGRSTSIRRAPIYADGKIGEWQLVSSLAFARDRFAALMHYGYMVCAGGVTSADAHSSTVDLEEAPTFWNQVTKSGRGLVRQAKVFYDDALQHRYVDAWFDDGASPEPDSRLLSMGTVGRALGEDRLPAAAELDITLANDDGGADWLVDRTTAPDVYAATVRLFIGTYDTEDTSRVFWQALGEYGINGTSRSDEGRVSVALTENLNGLLSEVVQPPTIREWVNSAATNNPVRLATGLYAHRALADDVMDTPIPLVFGAEMAPGIRCFYGLKRSVIDPLTSGLLFVFCATLNSGSSKQVNRLVIKHADVGTLDVPRENAQDRTIWEEGLGGTVTKDGRSWKVFYVGVNVIPFKDFAESRNHGRARPNPAPTEDDAADIVAAWVVGSPMSGLGSLSSTSKQSPESVLRDLITAYVPKGAAYLDEDALLRTEAALHKEALCCGTINSRLALRDALGSIAASWDFDIFADWTGRLSVTGLIRDYVSQTSEVANLLELAEAEIWDVEDRLPEPGQRWALANRASYDGDKPLVVPPFDPYDRPAQSWTSESTDLGTSRIVDARLSVAWRTAGSAGQNPFHVRQLDNKARPILSFTTSLRVVGALDCGSYFKASWTRNALGDPYSSAVFKVESMDVDTDAGNCRVTAVWVGDLATTRPYLFDDRTLILRGSANDGTATVTDSDPTVTFSNAVLVAAGVAAGDHLILRDATEAAATFKRNRVVAIASVTDANNLELEASSDLDFGSPGGTAVATWEIRRSHLTTPATSFPNYQDGSAMYGKVSSTDNPPVFSDDAEGNQLI